MRQRLFLTMNIKCFGWAIAAVYCMLTKSPGTAASKASKIYIKFFFVNQDRCLIIRINFYPVNHVVLSNYFYHHIFCEVCLRCLVYVSVLFSLSCMCMHLVLL